METTRRVNIAVRLLVRAGLSAVFVAAGVAKIADPAGFVRDLESYRLFAPTAVLAVASYLPWLEAFAAIGLWVRRIQRGATLILLGLTIGFLIAIGSGWVRGLDLRCGCFGSDDAAVAASYAELIGRDALILAGLIFLAVVDRRTAKTSQ